MISFPQQGHPTNTEPFLIDASVLDVLSVPPEHSEVMPEYDKWKLKQCQPTQRLKPFNFLGFDSEFFVVSDQDMKKKNNNKNNVGLLVNACVEWKRRQETFSVIIH